MSYVADYFSRKIKTLIKEHGIVVWYDPDQTYASVLEKLTLAPEIIFRYEGSYFGLRNRIESLMAGENRPEILIYIPVARAQTRYAMIEAEAAGCFIMPGHEERDYNTRLEHIASQVLERLSPAEREKYQTKIRDEELKVDDIDRLAEMMNVEDIGILKIIFKKSDPLEILTDFISSDKHDIEIEQKNAFSEIKRVTHNVLGLPIETGSLRECRSELLKALVITEFLNRGQLATLPPSLRYIAQPENEQKKQNCARLVEILRQRLPFQITYQETARRIEESFGLATLDLSEDQMLNLETFPFVEKTLFQGACQLFLKGQFDVCRTIAGKRRGLYWGSNPPYNVLWDWLLQAVTMNARVDETFVALKKDTHTVESFVHAYTTGERAWYNIDSDFHELESRYFILESEHADMSDVLERIIVTIRRRYTEYLRDLSRGFQGILQDMDFEGGEVQRQRHVFKRYIEPMIKNGKTAFVQVDALRYDLGAMLFEQLHHQFKGTIQPVLAQLPTITEVGMAAALPEADKRLALVTEKRKLGLNINGRSLYSREQRKAYLQDNVEVPFYDVKLDDIQKPGKKVRDGTSAAQFIWVTSTEIDTMGENMPPGFARRAMSDLIQSLKRGVHQLAALGVQHIILIADHGHLFGEEVDSGEKIDAPGGETISLHRRVWIGKGGARHDATMRVSESKLGLDGDLELVFPKGIAFFKSPGGNLRFVHGGISPQEMIIPLIILTARSDKTEHTGELNVIMALDKETITNRIFLVHVDYKGGDMFAPDRLGVKLLLQKGAKDVGEVMAATAEFDNDKKIIYVHKEKVATVTVSLTVEGDIKDLSVYLVNAETQAVLAQREEVPVELMS